MSNLSTLEILGVPNGTHAYGGVELADFGHGNRTTESMEDYETEYIFDRLAVRAIFITLYTIVFCSCFFGNLIVVLVVTLHWRMRSITNFCLANLAFANLCVAVFCIYQNLSALLIESWIFGDFMCKMYHFINSLSCTSSILILVVICIERYLAIIHPIRSRQILTINRLRFCIVLVWVLSAVYCSPRLYYFKTIPNRIDGQVEMLCILTLAEFKEKMKMYDLLNFFLIFLIPMTVLTVLYSSIAVTLWKTSRTMTAERETTPSISLSSSNYSSNNDPGEDEVGEMSGGQGGSGRENGEIRGAYLITLRGSVAHRSGSTSRRSRWSRFFPRCFRRRGRKERVCVKRCSRRDVGRGGVGGSEGEENLKERERKRLVELSMGGGDSGNIEGKEQLSNGLKPFGGQDSRGDKRIDMGIGESDSRGCKGGMPVEESSLMCREGRGSRVVLPGSGVGRQARFSYSNGKVEKMCKNGGGGRKSKKTSGGNKKRKKSVGKREGKSNVTTTSKYSDGDSEVTATADGRKSTSPPKLKRIGAMRICRIGSQALNSRRRVIRMLIAIVVTFAICNLPFHARKIWQIWSPNYRGGSSFSALFTPITFLIMYANCAINPILYAFMSTAFRASFKDLISGRSRASMSLNQCRMSKTCEIELSTHP